MVYPGAVHSRFEHSLGVYWLAGEAVHTIKVHQVGLLSSPGLIYMWVILCATAIPWSQFIM